MTDDADSEAAIVAEILATLAQERGIAISRDDPVLDVLLGSRRVLQATLAELIPPVVSEIRAAAAQGQADLERAAEAQAHWLEQEVLKDREKFLGQLQEAFDDWTGEIQARMEAQEGTLRRVVVSTVQVLHEQRAAANSSTRKRRKGLGWLGNVLAALAGLLTAAAIVGIALWTGYLTPS